MKTLRIVFCDDDPIIRSHMRKTVADLLKKQDIQVFSSECGTPQELSALLKQHPCDLLFLDIDLPEMDGIRIGELLREKHPHMDILYVSNLDERVYDVFRVHPWSFVRKSRFDEEITGVMLAYIRALDSRVSQLVLQDTDGKAHAVEPEQIVYVESTGKTQTIHFTGERPSFSVRCSLRELEEMLSHSGFIRTHKGFLVNYRCIRKITSRGIVLDSGDSLPVGRERLQNIRESYLALMKWKGAQPVGYDRENEV